MRRAALVLCCTVLFLTPLWSQTPDEKKATIAFVQKLQYPEGGFVPAISSASKPGLRYTSSALRVFKYNGGEAKDRPAIAKFVQAHFDKTTGGYFDFTDTKPDSFTTAVGIMAAVDLKLSPETYIEPALKYLTDNAKTFEEIRIAAAGFEAVGKRSPKTDAWLEEIAKTRNPDGTYGKGTGMARSTGSAVAAVLRLGGKVEQRDNVVKALKAGQRDDGGFGKEEQPASDLETTYRVMRAFVMLKEKPDQAKLRAFVAKCRNPDGGTGVAPGQNSTVSGTYFSSIILHWLEQK
jgi:prenyltransferase beta subunit